MFRQTHIRLTLLNSLVFIVLIGALGSVIYAYTYDRLYHSVDMSLMDTVKKAGHGENGRPQNNKFGGGRGGTRDVSLAVGDPRVSVLIWDQNGNLVSEGDGREVLFLQQYGKLVQPKVLNEVQTVQAKGFTFRTVASEGYVGSDMVTVQLIRNVTSEQEFLEKLLIILAVGCGVGIICAVGAGYFLAGRALVPIQRAWNKQQQFVSDASHELRTPLAVIQSKTDLLFRNPSATIEDKITDISTISNEGRRLSKLVTTLLTLARSDSNQIEMKKEPFALHELLENLVDQYGEIASYQEKSLTMDVPEPVMFTADKERIHQLLVILLDNAMKYTGEGGRIELACQQTASAITLQVKDTGIGMSEEDIPRIFDRFYQSDKARTIAEDAGLGLGLSIAQWIIDKHNGRVKVQSKLGEGTSFEITFPKHQK
ncbi:sensor histidine kinase [Ectobacillus ponti]|uniref:histidine kinase n=1 Tax=Ectobacillus ponti TaxID=2961894 RepID=A0AA41XAU0_9BACI|nr:HAMP domain-containing sensor histidine kinase [Ectobacillus ponti]MCP8969443.1 HAMP domain-containing histidine kinase [Ectobacillus ponti]